MGFHIGLRVSGPVVVHAVAGASSGAAEALDAGCYSVLADSQAAAGVEARFLDATASAAPASKWVGSALSVRCTGADGPPARQTGQFLHCLFAGLALERIVSAMAAIA